MEVHDEGRWRRVTFYAEPDDGPADDHAGVDGHDSLAGLDGHTGHAGHAGHTSHAGSPVGSVLESPLVSPPASPPASSPKSSPKSLPKSVPDYESAGAVWASAAEVLRGRSVAQLLGRAPPHPSRTSRHSSRTSRPASKATAEVADAAEEAEPPPVEALRLRANEPLHYFPLVASGIAIPPLAIPPEYADCFTDIPF